MINAPHCLPAAIAALLAAAWAVSAVAQQPAPAPASSGTGVHLSGKSATSHASSRADFSSLGRSQRQALAPLAPHWSGMNDTQRRKWIAISHNFESLSEADQARLHARMSEWAGLSNQQRAQARLNFAETSKLAPDHKKERWEAYQALSEEERKRLASSGGAARPAGRGGGGAAHALAAAHPAACRRQAAAHAHRRVADPGGSQYAPSATPCGAAGAGTGCAGCRTLSVLADR